MLNIVEYNQNLESELKAFKSLAWADADREHYGDILPDFRKEYITLVAKDEGDIVGYIYLIYDAGVVLLDSLLVHPERKGQGVGTQLLLTAEEQIKTKGAHRIWLETGSTWKARKFYEKHGYIVRSILADYYDHREFVVMEKFLQ